MKGWRATSAGGATGLAGERAVRILLGFLLESQGKEGLAQSEWQSLVSNPGSNAAAASPAAKADGPARTGI